MKKIKIFISSPSDVIYERLIAQKVIAKLNREFQTYLEIEGVFWEREPLVVTSDYQTLITKPSETDIVIVILWSRLGTPLDSSKYKGEVTGKKCITGTEWEFEEAYKCFLLNQKPNIFLYKKSNQNKPTTRDIDELTDMLYQEKLVEEFFEYWLVDKQEGTLKAASHIFETTDIFEEMLEEHLRKELKKHLNDFIEYKPNWHKGSPFRGLESFEKEHHQVFFGRKKETHDIYKALMKQIDKENAFLLVLGASGSGKSSLVQAGLLPDLLLPGMVPNVALIRYVILKPSDNSNSLIEGLAKAIMSEKVLPELADNAFTIDKLVKHFKEATTLACQPIEQVFDKIAKKEQLIESAKIKLIIVIDQFEEIFTLKKITDEERLLYINLLSVLVRSGYIWIIATMRNDFYPQLDEFPELLNLTEGYGKYSVTFPAGESLGQIIVKPALEAGLAFEIDDKTGIGLDEILRKAAMTNKESLPLLEYMLEQLWQKRTTSGLLTYQAYEDLGRLEGSIGQKAENVFHSLSKEVQNTLPKLLRILVSISVDIDKKKTARKVNIILLKQDPNLFAYVNAMLDQKVRLLVSDNKEENGEVYIRIAHEALLINWKRAQDILNNEQNDIQLRDRLEKAASLWNNKKLTKKDKQSFLLHNGLALNQAQDLLDRREDELEEGIVKYIKESILYDKHLKRRKKMFYVSVFLLSIVVSIILVILTINANEQKNLALKNEKLALERLEKINHREIDILGAYFTLYLSMEAKSGKIEKIQFYKKLLVFMDSDKQKEEILKILAKYFSKKRIDYTSSTHEIVSFDDLFVNLVFRKNKYTSIELNVALSSSLWMWTDEQLDLMSTLFNRLASKDLPAIFQRYENLTNKEYKDLKYKALLYNFMIDPTRKRLKELFTFTNFTHNQKNEVFYTGLDNILIYEVFLKYLMSVDELTQEELKIIVLKDIERIGKVSKVLYQHSIEHPSLYNSEQLRKIQDMYFKGIYKIEGFGKYEDINKDLPVTLKQDIYKAIEADNLQEAKSKVKEILKFQKDNIIALDLLAYIFFLEEDIDELNNVFKIMVAYFPNKDISYINKIKGYMYILQNKELDISKLSSQEKKEISNAYILLADYYKKQKNYKEVIVLNKKALPYLTLKEQAKRKGSLSWYYLLLRQYKEAIEYARLALKMNPKLLWVEMNLAHAYLLSGEYEKAKKIYLKHKNIFLFLPMKRKWEDIILEDFNFLRASGIESSEYHKIEDLFSKNTLLPSQK